MKKITKNILENMKDYCLIYISVFCFAVFGIVTILCLSGVITDRTIAPFITGAFLIAGAVISYRELPEAGCSGADIGFQAIVPPLCLLFGFVFPLLMFYFTYNQNYTF